MTAPTALPLPASAVVLRAAGCPLGAFAGVAGRALFSRLRELGCNPARDCTDPSDDVLAAVLELAERPKEAKKVRATAVLRQLEAILGDEE